MSGEAKSSETRWEDLTVPEKISVIHQRDAETRAANEHRNWYEVPLYSGRVASAASMTIYEIPTDESQSAA